jgi:hypothetical protein
MAAACGVVRSESAGQGMIGMAGLALRGAGVAAACGVVRFAEARDAMAQEGGACSGSR